MKSSLCNELEKLSIIINNQVIAWKDIEQDKNIGLILNRFDYFLQHASIHKELRSLSPSPIVSEFANRLTVLSIISLSKPVLFINVLDNLRIKSVAALYPLFEKLFTYMGARSRPFEIALIISNTDICKHIDTFKANMLDNSPKYADFALSECNRLNLLFNSTPSKNHSKSLTLSINRIRVTIGFSSELPSFYHGRLFRLLYITGTTLDKLYENKSAFLKFVPHFIAHHKGLPPLSLEDEATFLQSMQTYFSFSMTCKAVQDCVLRNRLDSLIPCIVSYYIMEPSYQNSKFEPYMDLVRTAISKCKNPYSTLSFCKAYISTDTKRKREPEPEPVMAFKRLKLSNKENHASL